MLWIETSLPLNFGCEDDGEDFAVRFSGVYRPAERGRRECGMQMEPDEPAHFEVNTVEVNVGAPAGWVEFPQVFWTDRLDAQLQRIGIAETEGRIESDRDDAADLRRKERLEERLFGVAAE